MMINSKYKPKCGERGTLFYSDFKYPCKNEESEEEEGELIPEEVFENEFEEGGEGDVGIELRSIVVEGKEPEKKESAEKHEIISEKSKEVSYFEEKKKIQTGPCYTPVAQKSENLLARWKEVEKRNLNRNIIICPEPLDSYEKLLLRPFCPPWPPSPTSESRSEFSYTMKTLGKGSIPRLFCVLCDGDLYENGPLHDLHAKTDNIKRQSLLKNDKVKKLVGIRTRIAVHKICYEDYIKLYVKESENQKTASIENS